MVGIPVQKYPEYIEYSQISTKKIFKYLINNGEDRERQANSQNYLLLENPNPDDNNILTHHRDGTYKKQQKQSVLVGKWACGLKGNFIHDWRSIDWRKCLMLVDKGIGLALDLDLANLVSYYMTSNSTFWHPPPKPKIMHKILAALRTVTMIQNQSRVSNDR